MVGYLYIIKSQKNGRYYIGSSEDPIKRLGKFHNLGKVKATRYLIPWSLVFTQEYEKISMARKIEYKLKTYKSRIILEKIIKSGFCDISVS